MSADSDAPAADHQTGPSSRGQTQPSLARIGRLTLKELKETLRDRRTIITLVLMPILVYPLLSIVFQRLVVSQNRGNEGRVFHVAVENLAAARTLSELVSFGDRILGDVSSREAAAPDQTRYTEGTVIEFAYPKDLEAAVARLEVDVGVRMQPGETLGFPQATSRSLTTELIVQRSSNLSADAAEYLQLRLMAARTGLLEAWMARQNGSVPTPPVAISVKRIAPADGTTAFSLASLVPLILVLMTITGAVYPAIDLTAGERERGTLEALIAAPVPRMGLLFAKYVAVLTVAMLTAAVNLTAMTVTILSVGLGPMLFGSQGLSGLLIVQVMGLLILFSAFFSAVLLTITSFARSFKEAQAYLIPVMMLSMAPGIAALLPGVRLDAVLSVMPLLNIVLLARDLCEQQAVSPVLATVVIVSTTLYAGGALALAARIFGADAILYGSQGTWSSAFRRPSEPTAAPTVAEALLLLAILFPCYLLLSSVLGRTEEWPMGVRLAASGGLTALLFGGLPLAACLIRRIQLGSGLQLKRPSLLALLGAVFLGVSLWVFDFEVVNAARAAGVSPLTEEMQQRVREMIALWRTLPPVLILGALAIAPGICEELFFRGYLLTALRTRMKPAPAILLSAILFGLFHLITSGSLSVVRLAPSTMMGVVLGWVCVRTGSLYPGMLLHAVHNGLLLMIAYYADALKARGFDAEGVEHLPANWLATAAVVAVAGFAIVAAARRPADRDER